MRIAAPSSIRIMLMFAPGMNAQSKVARRQMSSAPKIIVVLFVSLRLTEILRDGTTGGPASRMRNVPNARVLVAWLIKRP